MRKIRPDETSFGGLDESSPALANPAVAHCCEAWKNAYREKWIEDEHDLFAPEEAGKAYRAALPPLINRDSRGDFLACVTFGILLGAIPEKNAGKLLYAAQIASSIAAAEDNNRKPSEARAKIL